MRKKLTFLSPGKLLILMSFPDLSSGSVYCTFSMCLYFSVFFYHLPAVFFNKNKKYFPNYQSLPLVFGSPTSYPRLTFWSVAANFRLDVHPNSQLI